jgi:hypothetical protein
MNRLPLAEPANAVVRKRQRKSVALSKSGPNQNRSGTKWNVYIGQSQKMMNVSAKQVGPVVAQLTGVNASQVIDRLKSGSFHSFGQDPLITVAKAGLRGEGVLDWLTKKVGQSGLFRTDSAPAAAPQSQQSSSIKDAFPADTKTLYQMNQNAYDNRCTNVGDWKCMSNTKTVQFYMKGNDIIVVIRGTASFQDLMADIKITFQNVRNSSRFKEDVPVIQAFQQQYPPSRYNYYFTGHSLGGALIDEYLKDGYGKLAISFNPAVQKEFYNSTNHHRIYNTQDPLYDLMGRHVPSAEVRQYKGKDQSTFEKFLGYIPIVNDAAKALKGHSLENYIGGRMKYLTPSVVDRPYMRGAGPLSGGFSFMDSFLKPVARLAIKGATLGSVDPDKLMRGNVDFKPENILPYTLKSGQNILAAKMGDPSGVIEQGLETAQGGNPWNAVRDSAIRFSKGEGGSALDQIREDANRFARRYRGEGRCRWVDKGTRYPDWQEVCD